MKAVIAVRVSPRPAENLRWSPEIQEQKCREWCAAQGHEVLAVVSDILVSGGSASRFDSIFRAVEQHTPDLFVVSDLSRWTRDRPSRFWAIKALLEDQGVQLASVDEPWLGGDIPFSDTITTATVEMNYQERVRLKRKVGEGVRKAWASGKRWGRPFGWTFDRGEWTQDVPLINEMYGMWNAGASTYEIGGRFGILPSNVRSHIRAKCQRDVVGAEAWDRAQARRIVSQRRDRMQSSIYRGLIICPFCGHVLQQSARWGQYRCRHRKLPGHDWWTISARRYVTPEVRRVLGYLRAPDTPVLPFSSTAQRTVRDHAAEIERLTMAWVKGRLSEERYEKAVKALEAERDAIPETLPTPEALSEYVRELSVIDLEDKDPETGGIANELLRFVIQRIDITPDREVSVLLRPGLDEWMSRD